MGNADDRPEQWWGQKTPMTDIALNPECGEILFGVDVPDWVRLPPELGHAQVRVLGAFAAPCPKCHATVRHLRLDGDIHVAECQEDHFLWYRRKEE